MPANIGSLNLHIEFITKCEIMINIEDTHVAKLWNNDNM